MIAQDTVDTTVVAAFAVGFVSFVSPCVLPLVPGYLSAVSGVSLAEIKAGEKRLSRILLPAFVQDTVSEGAVLLLFYSAGLAVPFLITAVAFTRATAAFRWLRDRYLIITAVSGAVLIAMGVLLFTGELTRLNLEAQQALDGLGLNFFNG